MLKAEGEEESHKKNGWMDGIRRSMNRLELTEEEGQDNHWISVLINNNVIYLRKSGKVNNNNNNNQSVQPKGSLQNQELWLQFY